MIGGGGSAGNTIVFEFESRLSGLAAEAIVGGPVKLVGVDACDVVDDDLGLGAGVGSADDRSAWRPGTSANMS